MTELHEMVARTILVFWRNRKQIGRLVLRAADRAVSRKGARILDEWAVLRRGDPVPPLVRGGTRLLVKKGAK